MICRGGVEFQNIMLVDGEMTPLKYWHPSGKGDIHDSKPSTGTITVMGKSRKYTAVIQLVDGMHQILQTAAAEPKHFTEIIPGDPAYIAFIEASGEGLGGVWMGGTE